MRSVPRRIVKQGQRHHATPWKAGQRLAFVGGGRTLRLFDGVQRADCRQDVAGLGLVAMADLRCRGVRRGAEREQRRMIDLVGTYGLC